MEYKDFSFEVQSNGLYIEQGYSRFIVSYYEQPSMLYHAAVQWVRDQGGRIPTLEQALILSEHRYEINEALKAAGQRPIGECLWTSRRHAKSPGSVYVVCTPSGNIDRENTDSYNGVRAIFLVKEK